MKKIENRLNHDFPDLLDEQDFENHGNHFIKKIIVQTNETIEFISTEYDTELR